MLSNKTRTITAFLVLTVVLLFGLVSSSSAAAPVISSVYVSNITAQGATVAWTTDTASSSLVDFGLTTSYGTTLGNPDEMVTSHIVVLMGLTPSTLHHLRVRSVNSIGQSTTQAGYTVTTSAAPIISDVRLESVTDNQAIITWRTDVSTYPLVAYGFTESYGLLVGDEENFGTTHSITIYGLTPARTYHYKPRASDIYGNYTHYSENGQFTTSAPYLQSFTTSQTNGTYGPGTQISIVATYQENVEAGSSVTVSLNTGVEITLNQISDNKLSGLYVVGSTGSGQNVSNVAISSISYQNVCDSDGLCYRGTTLPVTNINSGSNIAIDTTAPVFSTVRPLNQHPWRFNNITTSSDISYTLSEALSSGTITFIRTGGSADAGAPHTCTLTGTHLAYGAHNAFNMSNCQEGIPALVDGAKYTIRFQGTDLVANNATRVDRENQTFDISSPILQSFTSSTPNGTYGAGSQITIIANFNESAIGSMNVILDTGVEVTLSYSSIEGVVRGIYTVGSIDSGQSSSNLNVNQISYMGISDIAGNVTANTVLPSSNLADNSDIVIDTETADAPSLVLFLTDPVNISNVSSVTLRVEGETEATIHYSIDDNNGATAAITGQLPMEGDGSTDIAGLNLSSLSDGTISAQVQLEKSNGEFSSFSQDTVIKDMVIPAWWHSQYYADSNFSQFLGYDPILSPGTYYMRLSFSEALDAASVPKISIDAQGTQNDVSLVPTERVSAGVYRFTRTIVYDEVANGMVREDLILDSLTDVNGNTRTNASASYEYNEAAFTDTIKPTVTGFVTPDYAKAGIVNVSLVFSESMKGSVAPTVRLRKNNGQFSTVSGNYTGATTWTGSVEIFSGESNGPADLQVILAQDLASNIMQDDESVFAFYVDTVNPSVSVNLSVDEGPVKKDTINLTGVDIGSGIVTRVYGFSSDSTCNASDTLATSFEDGASFDITGNHTDYLCAKVVDRAQNTAYQLIGKLNVDNALPAIFSVTSDTTNGSYKAGDAVEIRVNFSEVVSSVGNVEVFLETGETDRSCTFDVFNANYGICTYIVQDGDISSDLNQISIGGTINDLAGNTLTNYTPATSLAANKNIIIDTVAPVIQIISPLQGNAVNGSTVVFFSDSEPTLSQCSFDGENWTSCASGSTSLQTIGDWSGLPEGLVTLYVKDTDLAGNVGTDTEPGITKDTNFPVVTDITADKSNGYYKVGTVIPLVITFSREVTSVGNAIVTLETGVVDRSCEFSINNALMQRCDYVVQEGDNSDDLNVNSVTGTIVDSIGNTLVSPTPLVNLADNKDIRIDTIKPIISSVNSTHSNGTFAIGEEIDIVVTFSEIVTSAGNVTVNLSSGGSCSFSISNSSSGTCLYTVAEGENSLDLTTTAITGSISDRAVNAMTNFSPGINLGANKNIKIDTTLAGAPTVTSVTSNKDDRAYTIGAEIDVTVNFSETVNSVGYVTVTFETGAIDRTCQFTLSQATSGGCTYTVRENDESSDLSVKSVSGTIYDIVNNPMTNTIPAINLNDLKNIVIDTRAPESPTIALTNPITDVNKTNILISGTGEANATIAYSIDDTNGITSAKTGTGIVSAEGVINVGGIDFTGLDGGQITASVILTDAAGNVGSAGTAIANSQIILPVITSVTSNKPDGPYPLGETINIRANFSENVTSSGAVTVVLETGVNDRSCEFFVNNSNVGNCDYVIQAGDATNDLNVKFISGNIYDQADNPMVNFSLNPNLADSKNIIIDTTPPVAPSIILLDPITDSNKSLASITGTGEANMIVNYSINDTNSNTVEKIGTGVVGGDGSINIANIDLTGLDGGTLTVSVFLTDIAGNIGATVTDTATSQIILPTISLIDSDKEDGAYREGEIINIQVNFSENVTSEEDILVFLETGDTDRSCTFTITNSNLGSCGYIVQAGDISSDLNVISVSGALHDQAGNPMLSFDLNSNLADSKNIIIDTTNVSLVSFRSTTPDGTYGPESNIEIVADYSDALRSGSIVTLSLNTGATVILDTILENTKLRGMYQVGASGSGEGTTDLSVTSISSQNVCDLAGNCLTETSLPNVNITTNSQIAIDAVSPVFSEVLPENSTNIENITNDSAISYTLSEDLASGRIVMSRTAWAEDPDSPHTCTLGGDYLKAGSHEKFNTEDCEFGGITLTSGTVYSISFTGQDAYGNVAREVLKTGVSYGLDLNPPIISSVVIESVTSSSALVRWVTDEQANSLVDFGETTSYGGIRGDSFDSETEHSVLLDGLTPGTTYKFRVRSTDLTDNQAIDDNGGLGYELATLSLPSILSVEVTDITFESARISWEIDTDVYSYVSYGETDLYGKASGNDSLLTTTQSVAIDNLKANEEYHYMIKIRDIFGNFSLGEDLTFITSINPTDNDGPVISEIVVSDITEKGATINWKTDEPATSYVEYGITEEYGEKYGNDILTENHSIILPAILIPNTVYNFKVNSSDANKNESFSENNIFTTTTAGGAGGDAIGGGELDANGNLIGEGEDDNTSTNVSISSIKESNISSSSATIGWKTSAPCNGMVRYGSTKEFGQVAGEDATVESITVFNTDHEIIITNLLSNTTYYYMVVSYDNFGNIFISDEESFQTGALSSVSGVSVSNISLESATITWETGDPVTSELEYGKTSSYGEVVTDEKISNYHKIELSGLQTGQTYHFRVKGNNKDTGLISSDDYIFATYPEPKVEKYEIGDVSDSTAVIKWITNVPTESSVDYSSSNDPGEKGVQGLADVVKDHEVKILGLKQGTEYTVKVKGMDVNKNVFESTPFEIKTDMDLTAPAISHISSKASLVNQKDDIIQAIIFWKTDEKSTSQVLFDVGMGGEELGQQSKMDANLTTNHLVVLTDLRPGTVYRFRVVSEDNNKNVKQSDVFSLLTPRKEKSVFQLIVSNFEQTFGWMQKMK
jgi:hypothetical protein